jgi:hypothetical protein
MNPLLAFVVGCIAYGSIYIVIILIEWLEKKDKT